MNWRDRGTGEADMRDALGQLHDPYHSRASVSEGDTIVIVPAKVFGNIELAMERLDNDIDTPVGIEDDVASSQELLVLIQALGMGPTLAVHVVNTAMRIMLARYPVELVRATLPAQYDLRLHLPLLTLTDQQHRAARVIFNRRMASDSDLTEYDVTPELESLDWVGQMAVFVALFYMFGSKVGALKRVTGMS